jgi:hypothetical protein
MNTHTENQVTETAQVLADMFTENTGSSILDSGSAYGRNWERNAGKTVTDLLAEDYLTLDVLDGKIEPYSITINAYQFLNQRLTFDAAMDAEYMAFTKDSQDSYMEDMANFCESVLGLQESRDIYGTGYSIENTYNHDGCLLSQTLQFATARTEDDEYIILQVHGGCDVRGGYTRPRVFTGSIEALILDADREWIRCECSFTFQFGVDANCENTQDSLAVDADTQLPICPECSKKIAVN